MYSSRPIRVGVSPIACLVAAIITLTAMPASAQRRALFRDDPGSPSANRPASNGLRVVVRSRPTDVDLTMLREPAAAPRGFGAPVAAAARSVALNLFQDADYVAALDHMESVSASSYAWVGDVIGQPGSQVVLAVADGVFTGKVSVGTTSFSIVPDGSGGYSINEIDATQLPRRDDDAVPGVAAAQAPQPDGTLTTAAAADAGDVFELLIYYTTAAKNAAGGAAAMNSHITLAVAEMNSAFQNSGIAVRAHLAASVESGYVETGSTLTDLRALKASTSVKQLRDQYAADLVAMVTTESTDGFGGRGDLKATTGQDSDNAFSVEGFYSYIAGIYDLAHEVGHNFGGHHEPGNGCPGLFSYSCGYTDFSHQFYDIMSYGLNCTRCTRANYFSSPLANYNGFPTGTSTQDNARTMSSTRVSVANYRVGGATSVTLGAPTGFTATASGSAVTLAWNAPASGVPTAYIIEAGTATGLANLANFNTGSTSLRYSTSGVGNGSYYVRVKATDGVTVSPASNEALLVVGGCSAAPAAPASLTSSVNARTVTLTWGAAAGATSYIVEAGTTAGSANAAVVDNGASTSLVAPGVGAGTYFVRVKARNACGTSGSSNEATVIVR